jgi:uncharacterized protein YkwD
MFHVKQFLFVLILLPVLSFSQGSMQLEDKPFNSKQARIKSVDSFLASFKSFKNYSEEEQAFFYWVNALRTDPTAFKEQVIEPFLVSFPEAKSNYAKSLLIDLTNQDPLPLVEPNAVLTKATLEHASDLVHNQKGISHSSSDGRNFQQRMNDAGITKCAGENILEGNKDALKAIIMLLIDQGVPDKGHRRALLNPSFNMMGCTILAKTSGEDHILVQLFSCR